MKTKSLPDSSSMIKTRTEYLTSEAQKLGPVEQQVSDMPNMQGWENAPSHAHTQVGIWDNDNGEKAGKVCELCLRWNRYESAKELIGKLEAKLKYIGGPTRDVKTSHIIEALEIINQWRAK